jgi:hypothetical protein
MAARHQVINEALIASADLDTSSEAKSLPFTYFR